jgi:hypothetical protein
MRSLTWKMFSLALAIAALNGFTSAQITNQLEFKTNDSFVAGQATLPAGTYTVTPSDIPDVLEISASTRGEPSVMVQAMGSTTNLTNKNTQGPQVIFNKFGNKMVLSQIWLQAGAGEAGPSTSYVYQLSSSHAAAKASKSGSASQVLVSATSK